MRSLLFQTIVPLFLVAFMPQLCAADVITIINPSFEDPALQDDEVIGNVNGWVIDGTGGGTWNINTSSYWNTPAPDGNQVGYATDSSFVGPASLTQDLSVSLLANSTYSLDAYVGHPIGFATQYSIDLLAGGNILASVSGTGPEGSFQLISFNFNSAGSAFVGQTLGIRLYSADAQTAFDAISLNVISVPEPSSLALISLITMCIACASKRSRRTMPCT